MFETLTERLGETLDGLTRRGTLREEDVTAALREVRIALLEADVALSVVRDLISTISEKAVGQDVLKSITPGQMVIKIVHDHLIDLLGSETIDINLNAPAPIVIMLVGLQGTGKTTTTAKLARHLYEKKNKKVMMASLDVRRPAAQEQLRILGDQVLIPSLDIKFGETPLAIAERALDKGRLEGYEVVLLDTAGRLSVDEEMMEEARLIKEKTSPLEVLLVADSMTGQDAVNTGKAFNDVLGLTGIILTRIDGDARGGAALSMRAITGCPIKLLGTGEQLDALELFHPDRIVNRMLGMGDVVGLVEKAQELVDEDQAKKAAAKLQKGEFDLEDMVDQLRQVKKMGGMGGIMTMLPGVGKIQKQMSQHNIDDGLIGRQEAIILSMTPNERHKPAMIKASRKRRIAAGSGTSVQEINKLLKQFQQMQSMMKKMKKTGGRMPSLGGGPGGMLPPGFGR
ncbi:MAG: signal recognition particle protein [Alphaproteobacteria bacterium]|nr:signal recognition particle protein [Alphaproteobacteria bacterium]